MSDVHQEAAHMSSWSRGTRTNPHYQYHNAERVMEESESEYAETMYPGLEATKPGEKPRVVVLGTGWGARRFLKGIDTKIYDVVCISPRDHMVYCETVSNGKLSHEPHRFKVAYDNCLGRVVLPALAQVAERQGKYLGGDLFNKNIGKQDGGKVSSEKDMNLGDPFVYKHLGSMASVGRFKALVDLTPV